MSSEPLPVVTVAITATTDRVCRGDDLAAASGVAPTRSWTAGQPRVSPSGHVYPKPWTESGWRLEVSARRTLDLPGMFEELRQLVEPVSDRIAAQVEANEIEVEFSAHIKMHDSAPIGTIPASLVALAAKLHAHVDLDLYVVDDDFTQPGLDG